jgi:S1-C subfamily serine protease
VQAGDIIIAIDGKDVQDIYDYMHCLEELKKGQEAAVIVKRGGDTLKLIVSP